LSAWWLPRTPVVITTARVADAHALAEIHARAFPRPWGEHEIEALLAEPAVFGLLARRANFMGSMSPIGFILVRAVAGEAEVLTIAVDPARRGQGHGRKLLQAATDRLKRDRVDRLFLEVEEGNAPAVGLYAATGFREVGRRKGYYAKAGAPPAAALVMRRDIG
jgi:ribosomal-protein-alanine N-acetyltransferase